MDRKGKQKVVAAVLIIATRDLANQIREGILPLE
jgi:hypothetical protein